LNSKFATATISLILMLGGTGCTQQASVPDASHSSTVLSDPSASSRDVLSMFRGTSNDVDLVDDPDQLTAGNEVVIQGEIVGFARGREWQFGGAGTEPLLSTVMEVRVTKAFKGADKVTGGTVYVEHFLAAGVTPGELNTKLAGYQCGLYLIKAAGWGVPGLLDATAGRPEGEPLWVTGAQTFVVQDKTESEVVWPRLDTVQSGRLEDAMPGGWLSPENG
jgi:hypothetical protein